MPRQQITLKDSRDFLRFSIASFATLHRLLLSEAYFEITLSVCNRFFKVFILDSSVRGIANADRETNRLISEIHGVLNSQSSSSAYVQLISKLTTPLSLESYFLLFSFSANALELRCYLVRSHRFSTRCQKKKKKGEKIAIRVRYEEYTSYANTLDYSLRFSYNKR